MVLNIYSVYVIWKYNFKQVMSTSVTLTMALILVTNLAIIADTSLDQLHQSPDEFLLKVFQVSWFIFIDMSPNEKSTAVQDHTIWEVALVTCSSWKKFYLKFYKYYYDFHTIRKVAHPATITHQNRYLVKLIKKIVKKN